jgi:hypothetical protein
MSVPLDRLYNYIENIATEITDNVIIYRFYPHGSKKVTDLTPYKNYTWQQSVLLPEIICNDQEPLSYSLYEGTVDTNQFSTTVRMHDIEYAGYDNLRKFRNIHDKAILLHSEKRSTNLEQYKNSNFIPAYYWSHAIIALDWFRFAEHAKFKKQTQKTFLIYNRAWGGTREYRLRFAEFLIFLDLQNHCKTSINPIEPELGIHYEIHKFKNLAWRPSAVLENFFPISNAHSHYSADFNIEDYEATDIEVVLETLFDDSRLHLTEKSLRPIACGQPFILAGTHGSLEYLRGYGFKTFGDVWDEQYDLIEDPEERLIKITNLMQQIANWAPRVRESKLAKARTIAEYNKTLFFSKDFLNQISKELHANLTLALSELENTNTSQRYFTRRKQLSKIDKIKKILVGDESIASSWSQYFQPRESIAKVVARAKKYYLRS